jgi:hypothetical protein
LAGLADGGAWEGDRARAMTTLREWFDVLVNPRCWVQNYPISPEWDAELTRLLDT